MTSILIIDTSTEACSAALSFSGVITERYQVAPRQHGELILPMVDSLLKEANITLSELDVIGFGCGPGAFTGLRICVSIAQGLAFGSDKPVVGVSSLQAMAQQELMINGSESIAAAIDARMGEVYWGLYEKVGQLMTLTGQEEVTTPDAVTPLDLESVAAVGTGWQVYKNELEFAASVRLNNTTDDVASYVALPSAKYMIPFVESEFLAGRAIAAEKAEPTYLRNDVAKKKGEQKKLKQGAV